MAKIIGHALPHIPWEDRPAGNTNPVWRYSGNPIIGRNGSKRSNSVFNSAVVPFEDGFAGVFRCDSRSISMDLFAGRSPDGLHWQIEDESLSLIGADPEIAPMNTDYILAPWKLRECVGDAPNVTFPCAALTDSATCCIAIYYGCADTVTGLAFTTVDELVRFTKENSL